VDGREGTVSRLLSLAAEEVPGPVHLELSPVPVVNQEPAGLGQPPKPVDPARLEQALSLVRQARRPVLILGSLAARRLRGKDFQGLDLPVLTTAAAKGCVDETGPNAGGVITGEVKELAPEAVILTKADLALGIGLRNTEVVLADPYPCPLICLDRVEAGLQEGFQPQLVLAADDLRGLAGPLLAELKAKSWGLGLVAERKARIEDEILDHGWLPGPVFRALQDRLGPAALLCPDTGLFCTVAETVWQARDPGDFCGSSVGRFMGSALPTAIGLSLSTPGRTVVCAMGDGGVRPYLAELKLAVENRLPLLFLLLSDGGYGTVASGAPPELVSYHAHGIKRPSWWPAMEGMGCPARPVSSLAELDQALDEWPPESGPLFVEASFDPTAYRSMAGKLR
jgi:acetolactate synthase-1/2/3 large subunit